MRFVVFGAGAVGGAIGVRLAEHGHSTALIGRGPQLTAVRQNGLRLESPDGAVTLRLEIVENPAQLKWTGDEVVLLTMKTQHTLAALQDLAAVAPPEIPIVCVQNAVENERLAIRYFENVYGICVMCPTAYVIPGVVQAWCDPITGLLDIGRYPSGVDEAASAIASALSASKFQSVPRTDIMRWKYGKLLMNLGNAHEAICGPAARSSGVTAMARKEAIACFRAAGIAFADDAEDKARRGDLLRVGTIEGRTRQGGSSWQSLQRQTLNVETDYFNGEIVLLGHLHGIPTPVNALLQRLSSQFAREGTLPGSLTSDQVIALLPANVQRELSANR